MKQTVVFYACDSCKVLVPSRLFHVSNLSILNLLFFRSCNRGLRPTGRRVESCRRRPETRQFTWMSRCRAAELPSCCAAELLSCRVVELPSCRVAGLRSCRVAVLAAAAVGQPTGPADTATADSLRAPVCMCVSCPCLYVCLCTAGGCMATASARGGEPEVVASSSPPVRTALSPVLVVGRPLRTDRDNWR